MSDSEELIQKIEQNKSLFDEYQNMDKTEIPLYEKNKGNEEFKGQNFVQAIKHYSKSLMGLDLLIKDKMIQGEAIKKQVENVQIPSLLNLAQCYINIKKFELTIVQIEHLERIQKDSILSESQLQKMYCRKGIAYTQLHYFDKANKCFEMALKISQDQFILQQIQKMKVIQQKQKEKNIQINKKMIESLDYVEKTQADLFYKPSLFRRFFNIICSPFNLCKKRKKE